MDGPYCGPPDTPLITMEITLRTTATITRICPARFTLCKPK